MFKGFFSKAKKKTGASLLDVVEKLHNEEHVFVNVNSDLGISAEKIMKSTPLVQMAYAYARRTAIAALYVQGMCDKDAYEHVALFFKAMQKNTGHTVDFQKAAAEDASIFLKSYDENITKLFEKKILEIANEYEVDGCFIDDVNLFAAVIETIHREQNQSLITEDPKSKSNVRRVPAGFIVEDFESGDRLCVVINEGVFHGEIYIKCLDVTSPLEPWDLHEDPFQDPWNFCGSGMGPTGMWSFSVSPTEPFPALLNEAKEAYRWISK